MLDALAAIEVEVFLDLPGLACVLVDRNPDLAVRAGQRPREQAGGAALDIEETNLPEDEQISIKAGTDIHAAAVDVVGAVIEIEKPGALGPGLYCAQPFEFLLIGRNHAA